MRGGRPFVVLACGLAFEARAGRGPRIVACRGHGATLAARLREAIDGECRGVISFGIAGGLDPQLPPGTVLIASSVIAEGMRWTTDQVWSARLADCLSAAVRAPLLASDTPLADAADKKYWFTRSGAAAVDMESHIAAACAAEAGLPFGALRAIADPEHRCVPASALAGFAADGSIDVRAVLGALVRRPRETAALTRVAVDTLAATRALVDARRRLGPGFGLLDLP